jgi:hypothetical protein
MEMIGAVTVTLDDDGALPVLGSTLLILSA